MKILLFGKDGQVGWELQRSLAALGELIALDKNSTKFCGDFTDLAGIAETVATVRPEVIVNAAAHTAVDKAESEPELAQTLNALAPGVLADAAQKLGSLLVHYSTDYVFDGTGDHGWNESDTPAPLNVYGRSKLEGERLVAQRCSRHLILRTGWVYGARGSNFAKTMLRLARERERLAVVADQIGAPTGAELLADVTAHALRAVHADSQLAGLYHLTAAGETSWHGYACFVIETALSRGVELKLSADALQPILTSAYPSAAARPRNCRLDCSRLEAAFGLRLPPWQLGVARMLAELPDPT